MDRFDRFDDDARRVLTYAQEEALRLEQHHIGTEHILLGLVRVEEGVAARVLHDLGADPGKIRMAVEFIIGRGGRPSLEVGLTPRAKRVIELAIDEARRLEHGYIGTEHLLLGLVREGEGIAAGVLESLGIDLEKVRIEVIRIVGATPQGDPLGSLRRMTFVHGPASIDAARRELESAEAYWGVQAAALRRVVGIGGVALDAGIVVELVALEVRATGGLLYWTARPDPARTLGEPEVAVIDDAGTAYVVHHVGGRGNDVATKGEILVVPAPPDVATELRVAVAGFAARRSSWQADAAPGRWDFVVRLR